MACLDFYQDDFSKKQLFSYRITCYENSLKYNKNKNKRSKLFDPSKEQREETKYLMSQIA